MLIPIVQALFIGILSSAPMGPVGMLCVQRTLNEGRRAGLITGLAAVVGDLFYAFVTMIGALGLSMISQYIEKYQTNFQIAGSIILIIFAVFIYRQNPSRSITKIERVQLSFGKLFVSSLLLTLSNIGMLFLYMALFTRFQLFDHNLPFLFSILIILAIGAGALLWWFFITYVVSKLRHKFNPRGLQLFNRILGTILIIIGIVGIITGIYIFLYP